MYGAADSRTFGSRRGIVVIQVIIDTTNLYFSVYINCSHNKYFYKRKRKNTQIQAQQNSSLTVITIIITVVFRIYYKISLTQQTNTP